MKRTKADAHTYAALAQKLRALSRRSERLDAFAVAAAQIKRVDIHGLNTLTAYIAGEALRWDKKALPRWDLASTGCVGNISPLFGYLWLMTRRDVYVPKISSRGTSCGTVDILEAAGQRFPRSLHAIQRLCQLHRGVLCQPGNGIAELDERLMDVRRDTNTIKIGALVYASILAKKLAMGCTHAIVDIKIGKDTKFRAAADAVVDSKTDQFCQPVSSVMRLLRPLGLSSVQPKSKYALQSKVLPRGTLESVRWFATNADTPQCRAVGRYLILVQLDLLLGRKDSLPSKTNDSLPKHLSDFYFRELPHICGVNTPSSADLKAEFSTLRKRWQSIDDGGEAAGAFAAIRALVCSKELTEGRVEGCNDLYHISSSALPSQKGCTVASIDAYSLDSLFTALCGEDKFDREVGIWLHALPGEVTKNCAPFITVFYKPSRTPSQHIRGLIDRFLLDAVEVR